MDNLEIAISPDLEVENNDSVLSINSRYTIRRKHENLTIVDSNLICKIDF